MDHAYGFDIEDESRRWRAAVGNVLQGEFLIRGRTSAAILAAALCSGLLAANPIHAQDKSRPDPTSMIASARPARARAPRAPRADPLNVSAEPASDEARQVVSWVIETGDNHGMPFVIVDKKDTRVFVFDGGGRLLGNTSALIGLARGDDSAPGIGVRKLSDIRPDERTTPAGRFVASLGHGAGGQDILWLDYASALALHRISPTNSKEHRLQRLASTSPFDHRITFGCINVPTAFYDAVIDPAFAETSGIVYILPEIRSISEVFAAYAPPADKTSSAMGRVQHPSDN
jgi:hypothetical protein